MLKRASKNRTRQRIHRRIRTRVVGREGAPRLNVYRSLNHIYAQIVDDSRGQTLVSASSLDKEVRKTLKSGGNVAAAKTVGQVLAARAQAAGIARVVFDRGGYGYHGRVKALADAAREGGLKF
jgi:large subunit ribosomal protein L18